jgi:5-methylcytosine-specific restriction endonuclease McrA
MVGAVVPLPNETYVICGLFAPLCPSRVRLSQPVVFWIAVMDAPSCGVKLLIKRVYSIIRDIEIHIAPAGSGIPQRRDDSIGGATMSDTIPQDDIPRKQCSACLNTFLATPEFFFRSKRGMYGLRSICKQCYKEDKHPKKPELPPYGWKHCPACKGVLPVAEFSRESKRKDGLSVYCKACNKQRFEVNKERIQEQRRRFREANRDALREQYKKFRAGHQERKNEQNKRSYASHKDRAIKYMEQYRKNNRETLNENKRQYYKTEQGKMVARAAHSKRKSLKINAIGTHTAQDIAVQFEKQHGQCHWCKKKFISGKNAYHVDHVIPLSRGGSNDPSNLVLACPTCNLSKNNRLPHEWIQGGTLL